MRALVRVIRRSIALKLTLTLVGFVAVSSLVAGLYLDRALQAFAVESLETRLGAVAAVVQDEARALLRAGAPAGPAQEFVLRLSRSAGARVTLIASDGRVLGESERAGGDLTAIENHAGRPEVRGDGVVGEQPRLEPGQSFQYTSGCVLTTPVGTMHGSYRMWADDGSYFDALIAPFSLASPVANPDEAN